MNAALVYDGGDEVIIPASMGLPCTDQLTGTPLENLGEISSRICYDSLGLDEKGKRRGRPAEKLHEHILEVRNHSVYEHCNFTVWLGNYGDLMDVLLACLNRKGLWVDIGQDSKNSVAITTNFRSVIEWPRHTQPINRMSKANWLIGHTLRRHMSYLAPKITSFLPEWEPAETENVGNFHPDISRIIGSGELNDDQAWISLWLYGSRGMTHEQIRHRFAMSQRSTRYVDEDGSPYIQHPLVTKYLNDPTVSDSKRQWAQQLIDESIAADRKTYQLLVEDLQQYGLNAGLDKQTARKQARGASRGYLGNALASEMIYSAPISGWKWILSQRACAAADAEIRAVYERALPALQKSRYGDRFTQFKTKPSPDSLGVVLV